MLTYNKKNNKGEFEQAKFITTDDILIGSDSTKSMEDLTTAIAQNSADIVELKSNIKWLAAHGGSGSGVLAMEEIPVQCPLVPFL